MSANGVEASEPGRPSLSLILCSRNDAFQGNSLWRLETTLNHTARLADELGRLDDLEVVVSDWGSRVPLRDVVRLVPEARRVVRFVTVPFDLAEELQGDSRFAEVIALNAAARRARGSYIGRIDQDTLVGRRFLEWFFAAVDQGADGFNMERAVMISNRRRIPYHFAVRCPPLPVVERYVDVFGRWLPRVPRGFSGHYWECYIGILLVPRALWQECGGYDESYIYYGLMEIDLFLRLRTRYAGVDLGAILGEDFLHLDHVPSWILARADRGAINPVLRTLESPPPDYCPSGPWWGLASHDLPVEPGSYDGGPGGALETQWGRAHWREFVVGTVLGAPGAVALRLRDEFTLVSNAVRNRVGRLGRSSPGG
jgi:hypothetical protein